MQWTIQPVADFDELAKAWLQGGVSTDELHPFLHPEFLATSLSMFSAAETRILVGRTGDDVVLLLPIQREGPVAWRSFNPSQLPLAPLFLRSGTTLDIDVSAISETLPGLLLMFTLFDYDSDAFPALAANRSRVEEVYYGTTMSIDANLDFAAYWAGRSKKLRDNIKRYARRAEESGIDLSFEVNTTPEAVDSALGRYADLESAGWKGRSGTAIGRDNLQGEFYSRVLQGFAGRRKAAIFELRTPESVISSRIGIMNDSSVVFLKTTYDEEYKKISPGRLQLYFTLEHLLEQGEYSTIDFYTKANRDQLQWSTAQRDIVHLNIYRSGAVHAGVRVARRAKGILTAAGNRLRGRPD